jgi:rhamnogalacturonyl hydrolase YesR
MNSIDVEKVKRALLSMQRYPWEQGLTAQAFLEIGDMDTAVELAKGSLLKSDTSPCSVVSLIEAVKFSDNPQLAVNLGNIMHGIINRTRNDEGILFFGKENTNHEMRSEAIYTLLPALAVTGYYRDALHNLNGYWDILYNSGRKLFHHRWDDVNKTFIGKDFWGTGNGLALSGMVKMYELLPVEYASEKKEIAAKSIILIDSLLAHLTPDNLLHNFVDDPSSFTEVNCPQMLAYSIYCGLTAGWLDPSYLPHAEKIRETTAKKVDKYGFVRDVCGISDIDQTGVAPEGQAFCLMLDAAAKKYYGNYGPGL